MLIDYLSLSVPNGDYKALVRESMALLGIHTSEERRGGLYGYTSSIDLGGFGVIAHGGDAQRGTVLVSFNGSGCARIASMGSVREFFQPLGARITRLDIAADDFNGAFLDVPRAITAWRDGCFKYGARQPKSRLVDDLGSGEGCTLYVGSRASGKLCRIYEKGKQLGDTSSKWVRGEVELHAKDRVIPWEAVTEPVKYLAGAYPFFAALSLVAERIRTFKHSAQVSLERVVRWARLAVGKTINVMLGDSGGDIVAVIDAIKRPGVPKRLSDWYGANGQAVSPCG